MKTSILSSIVLTLFCSACFQDEILEGKTSINENFESIRSYEELIEGTDPNWIFFQITEGQNTIAIDTSLALQGKQCLKFFAVPSNNGASKCDIANNNMIFQAGEIFRFSAYFYLEGEEALDDIFLFDLEESTAIGAGPGIRLALDRQEGFLKIERKKMLEADIRQASGEEIVFPRNQWVLVVLEIKLSQKKEGSIKLYQDGTLLIEANNVRTLPVDKLTIIQGSRGIYNSVQVGITANSPLNPATLYVDDISISN